MSVVLKYKIMYLLLCKRQKIRPLEINLKANIGFKPQPVYRNSLIRCESPLELSR